MSSIRIAIIGGGIAGTSLMYALKKYSHLDVHIFESAAEFKEADMALGVACSTRVALELMGPEAEWFLERAGAVPMKSVRIMFAQGEAARKVADEINEEDQWKHLMGVVHRAAFFQELLSHIPRCRMHASKKLQKIDRSDSITLYFADGTTHECDILVGADGIHSTVRKLVLGESDPAASPQRNGAWLLETHQPFNKARASLGEKLVDMGNICEYGWMGCNAFLTHNILGGGQLVRFAICSFAKEAKPSDRWQRKVGADEIRELFRDFPPRPKYAVNELLCNRPVHNAFYLWDHPRAHTYINGPICVTGNAAHSMIQWQGTQWQASAGGMAIEDSLILSTLLGRAKSSAEAVTALKVYDQFRRPRTQQIAELSQTIGTMILGANEEVGLDPENFKPFLLGWNSIIDIDMDKHRDEALRAMEAELRA